MQAARARAPRRGHRPRQRRHLCDPGRRARHPRGPPPSPGRLGRLPHLGRRLFQARDRRCRGQDEHPFALLCVLLSLYRACGEKGGGRPWSTVARTFSSRLARFLSLFRSSTDSASLPQATPTSRSSSSTSSASSSSFARQMRRPDLPLSFPSSPSPSLAPYHLPQAPRRRLHQCGAEQGGRPWYVLAALIQPLPSSGRSRARSGPCNLGPALERRRRRCTTLPTASTSC